MQCMAKSHFQKNSVMGDKETALHFKMKRLDPGFGINNLSNKDLGRMHLRDNFICPPNMINEPFADRCLAFFTFSGLMERQHLNPVFQVNRFLKTDLFHRG
jgi:hypothetical protein